MCVSNHRVISTSDCLGAGERVWTDSDSELFIQHCLPSNRIAQIRIVNDRKLPLGQLVVADMGAT